MINIRDATEADDRTIKRMIRAARLDPTSLKWQNFLIAELDGQIVGIGQIKQYPGCEELGSLVTLPQYQGQGVATQIMHALEARAGRPLYLLCLDKMQPFYERFGYEVITWGEAPRFLKIKLIPGKIARLIGMRVLIMRKD